MHNVLLDNDIITPSGKISKDKINPAVYDLSFVEIRQSNSSPPRNPLTRCSLSGRIGNADGKER